jgi:cell division protein FtsB
MRIRRSVTRVFAAMVLPAICCAVTAYFGYYTIWGSRGALALEDTQAQLGVRQEQLAQLHGQRALLEQHIDQMRPGHVDLDLLEHLSRDQLMNAAPDQVAIPRQPEH